MLGGRRLVYWCLATRRAISQSKRHWPWHIVFNQIRRTTKCRVELCRKINIAHLSIHICNLQHCRAACRGGADTSNTAGIYRYLHIYISRNTVDISRYVHRGGGLDSGCTRQASLDWTRYGSYKMRSAITGFVAPLSLLVSRVWLGARVEDGTIQHGYGGYRRKISALCRCWPGGWGWWQDRPGHWPPSWRL